MKLGVYLEAGELIALHSAFNAMAEGLNHPWIVGVCKALDDALGTLEQQIERGEVHELRAQLDALLAQIGKQRPRQP